jgi:hypothetical protein
MDDDRTTGDLGGALPAMHGGGEEPEPTPRPVKNTIEAASSLSVASGDGDDPAIDEPVGPPLLVQQTGEELGTIMESGTGSNHPEAADADHSSGDPDGAPSSEAKIQPVTVQKKKRRIQHPELFPEELPALEPAGSTIKIADGSSHGGGVADDSSSPDRVGAHPGAEEPGAEPPHAAVPRYGAVATESGSKDAGVVDALSAEKPVGAHPSAKETDDKPGAILKLADPERTPDAPGSTRSPSEQRATCRYLVALLIDTRIPRFQLLEIKPLD